MCFNYQCLIFTLFSLNAFQRIGSYDNLDHLCPSIHMCLIFQRGHSLITLKPNSFFKRSFGETIYAKKYIWNWRGGKGKNMLTNTWNRGVNIHCLLDSCLVGFWNHVGAECFRNFKSLFQIISPIDSLHSYIFISPFAIFHLHLSLSQVYYSFSFSIIWRIAGVFVPA